MSEIKSLKRFLVCYKKQKSDGLKKEVIIQIAETQAIAIYKVCERFNIPDTKVVRYDKNEGWIYCNEIYNPLNEEIIAAEKEKE